MSATRFMFQLVLMFVASVTTARAAIISDIVFLVDETRSMTPVQNNIRDNIGAFAQVLADGGVDARFGLVGFGSSSTMLRTLTDLTDAASFAAAAQNLVATGITEPAWAATAYALNQNILVPSRGLQFAGNFSYRANAIKNLVLITDEPDTGTTSFANVVAPANERNFPYLDALLDAEGALFNAVLQPGGTTLFFEDFVGRHGGNVFDLTGLNTTDTTVVDAFVAEFSAGKLQELVDYCTANPSDPACVVDDSGGGNTVPLPGTLVLLSLSGAPLALQRRKNRSGMAGVWGRGNMLAPI